MSSSKPSEKPTISSTLAKFKGSIEDLEGIDKHLKSLLERLTTLEESMVNLPLDPVDEGDGDAHQDLKSLETLEDEMDEQEKDIGAVGEIKKLDKKATGNH